METKNYSGGCHCGAVRFDIKSPEITSVIECNCSHCEKKGFLLTFLPESAFTLLQGEQDLTEYTFNTGVIKHQFCSKCGTQSFSYGKDTDNNSMVAINVRCIDDIDVENISRQKINGKDR